MPKQLTRRAKQGREEVWTATICLNVFTILAGNGSLNARYNFTDGVRAGKGREGQDRAAHGWVCLHMQGGGWSAMDSKQEV